MSEQSKEAIDKVISLLEQQTRGTQLAIYTVAGIGLAFAVHRVRPLSKFSTARRIPKHFIKEGEILHGKVVGCEPSSASTRLLIDHRPLIRIPIWHSKKPPLPVDVWGVKPAGSNGLNWLQCIAVGNEASLLPISTKGDTLIAQVQLHLPILSNANLKMDAKQKKRKKIPTIENVDLATRLVELGMNVAVVKPANEPSKHNWWTPWIVNKSKAAALQRAEYQAKSRRVGCWQDIPSSHFHNIYAFIKSKFLPITVR